VESVQILVLAGGAGTRFWPASRAARPKQLLPLCGPDSMIADTVRRVTPLLGESGAVWVATGAGLVAGTLEALPSLSRERVLVEPAARNTAPCIGWAAAAIARVDPEAVVIVLPSDHHIADEPAFLSVMERAVTSARNGAITTIGIRPTRAETGFGYIEVGEEEGPARRGVRFVEKPDRATAEVLVASGRHLWNGGMFLFRARDMLDAIRAHLPALADALQAFDAAAAEGGAEAEAKIVAERFPTLPSVSIDVGIMEKLPRFAVVPGDFGWSDVGSWQAAWELADKDPQRNQGPEHAVFVDATGNHVVDLRSAVVPGQRAIALVGVADLVVVETDDATLVVPRDRAQDVRLAVDALKASGRGRLV
jgi:mannose-1-phosphate guanylyltransferase